MFPLFIIKEQTQDGEQNQSINTVSKQNNSRLETGPEGDDGSYTQPTNIYLAHGFNPVIVTGAEIMKMVRSHGIEINDSGLQDYGSK